MEDKITINEQDYKQVKETRGSFCADLVKRYIEKGEFFINKLMFTSVLELFKGKDKDGVLKSLFENIGELAYRDHLHAYLSGVYDGVVNHDNLKNSEPDGAICDVIKEKDFTIMVDFGNNDYCCLVESAAKEYVNTYMTIAHQVNCDYNENRVPEGYTSYYEGNLKYIEKLEIVSKYIANACIAKGMLDGLYTSCDSMSFFRGLGLKPKIENLNFLDEFKDNAFNTLGLCNVKNYKKGTFKEIEEYVIENYAPKNEEKPKDLNSVYLDGKVLFISMKDGLMRCWVQ